MFNRHRIVHSEGPITRLSPRQELRALFHIMKMLRLCSRLMQTVHITIFAEYAWIIVSISPRILAEAAIRD